MIVWLDQPLRGEDGRLIYGYQREDCKPCPDFPGPRECEACTLRPVYKPEKGKIDAQNAETSETLETGEDEVSPQQALGESDDQEAAERLIPGQDYDEPELLEVRCSQCGHPHAIQEGQLELECAVCTAVTQIEGADIIRLNVT